MLNTDILAKILSHSAYNERMPPPQRPMDQRAATVALTKLRKKDLDNLGVSDSPLKNMHNTPYGECLFSQKIITWKKEKDIPAGRNAAIVLFRHPHTGELDYTISATDGPPGAPHAELKALDALPQEVRENKQNIISIYTERKPCRHGSNCSRKIKQAISSEDTSTFFSAHHTPNRKRAWESEYNLQVIQHEHGIRVANTKIKKKLRYEQLNESANSSAVN